MNNLPVAEGLVLTAAKLRALVSPAYVRHLRELELFAGDRQLGAELVTEYLRRVEASAVTVGTKLARRHAVFSGLRAAAGHLPIAEAAEARARLEELAKRVPHSKRRPNAVTSDRVLTSAEYGQLLGVAANPRVCSMLKFLWMTGARVSELCGVRLGQCRQAGDQVKVVVLGKGRKERELVIPQALFAEISETFHGRTWLFEGYLGKPVDPTYVSHRITELGEAVGLGKHISAHTLRHSWATRKIRAYPGKLDAVSRYLGHSRVSTTVDFYCHTELEAGELLDEEDLG